MHRIVLVGNDRAARLVIEHVLALLPEVAFTVFGPALSPREGNWFTKNRVDLRSGILATRVDRFARNVTGSDGSRNGFDWLILTDSCTELARLAKLQVSKGVLVNAYMQTSDGYVYALGDSVECPVGIESLSGQAKAIANHIYASSPRTYTVEEFAFI